jgi:hypothetical protein
VNHPQTGAAGAHKAAGRPARALATVAMLAGVLVYPPLAADAAVLGTLTLAPSSGSVYSNSPALTVTTDKPCPAGFSTNATLKAGRDGVYSNLRAPGSDGRYDTAPITLTANRPPGRPLTGSESGPVRDGDYEIIVICSGQTQGNQPDVFSTTISVAGDAWRVKADTANAADPGRQTADVEPTPFTGLPLAGIAVGGLGLIVAGIGVRRWVRRRRAQ